MIATVPIDIERAKNLIAEVNDNIRELKELTSIEFGEFHADKRNYGLTEHYFRRALEGILTLGTHFLSRIPAKTKDYQEVIVSLGKYGIVPAKFADKNKRLAGYRNRLVHLYWEVSEEELFDTITRHLPDLEEFLEHFQKYLKRQANAADQ